MKFVYTGLHSATPTSGSCKKPRLARSGFLSPDPSRYGLDLVFPLAFMGLLAAFLKDCVSLAVALGAGRLALVGADLLSSKEPPF